MANREDGYDQTIIERVCQVRSYDDSSAAEYRILLPVDGSEAAARAVAHVLGMHRMGLRVSATLLNVQLGTRARSRSERREQMVLQFDAAHLATTAAVDMLRGARVPCVLLIRFGDPARTIIKCAVEHQCAQIVMGTRGLGNIARVVLGSVADRVVQSAPMPVALVK